jgi:rubrerythrin
MIMDIFEFAMQMELDGRNFYLELAGKANDQGLQSILEMLAADEMKHYNILQDMKIKKPKMAKTKVLDDAKNIFREMRYTGEDKRFPTAQIDLYKKAQEIEERSRVFYEEKEKEVEKPYQKKLFRRIAEEEKKHYNLLEHMIQLVSRPEQWLENAEWHHLDEY